MVAKDTKAIIFDCIGVLYKNSGLLFNGNELNTELVTHITKNLKPNYKVGLLSNIDREWIDTFISKHHLEGLFDVVVVSGDEGMAKPDASIYLRISGKLGTAPEACVIIDDLLENCAGAEKVGMKSIVYKDNQQIMLALSVIINNKT